MTVLLITFLASLSILVWMIADMGGTLADVWRVAKGVCAAVGAVSILAVLALVLYCARADGYDTVGLSDAPDHMFSYENFSFMLFHESGNLMIGW
jgi:hypothetical protein